MMTYSYFCFIAISSQDVAWYTLLTTGLTTGQTKALQDIVITADYRQAIKDSKLCEEHSGFTFSQQNVPNTFGA